MYVLLLTDVSCMYVCMCVYVCMSVYIFWVQMLEVTYTVTDAKK